MNEAAELAKDLRAVAAGTLTEVAFREKYSGRDVPEVEAVWHGLQHYFADADIRARDAEYSRMQAQELERLIQLLESDASLGALDRVGFLGPSKR